MAGKSQAELAILLRDHYRSQGHEMADGSGGALYGSSACPESDELCLYVEVPEDRSGWPATIEHLGKPEANDIEVVAETWSYYI